MKVDSIRVTGTTHQTMECSFIPKELLRECYNHWLAKMPGRWIKKGYWCYDAHTSHSFEVKDREASESELEQYASWKLLLEVA